MAKKDEPKVVLERTYNVPLRKGFQKAPDYKRAKKATVVLREFIKRHMKASLEDIRIGKYLNNKIWERGIKNPPHHVKIDVVKFDDGIVKAELVGAPKEDLKKKKEVSKKKESKKETEIKETKTETKKEEAKEQIKDAKKEIEKELIHEQKETRKAPKQEKDISQKPAEKKSEKKIYKEGVR